MPLISPAVANLLYLGPIIMRGAKMGWSHFYGRAFVLLILALGMALSLLESAFAGTTPVPGPVIGAGLPALAILAGGFWLVRKIRQRR